MGKGIRGYRGKEGIGGKGALIRGWYWAAGGYYPRHMPETLQGDRRPSWCIY